MASIVGVLGGAILFALFGYMTFRERCGDGDCLSCAGDSCAPSRGGDGNLESSKASAWWPESR